MIMIMIMIIIIIIKNVQKGLQLLVCWLHLSLLPVSRFYIFDWSRLQRQWR